MTDSRWPILGLDGDATEAQIRRAYAARLRAQGADAAVEQFAALRAEFEAALESVRSHRAVAADVPRRSGAAPDAVESRAPLGVLDPPDRSAAAVGEIRALLAAGDLAAACVRYDVARAAGEIGLGDETVIETELARGWLADRMLGADVLADIARRYRWDDVVTTFALAPEIVVRLRADAPAKAKPGTRFIGKWNWGAFCLTPFWLFAHGRTAPAVRILVSYVLLALVPFVGVFGVLWIAITYGRRGNAIAVRHRAFRDEQQFIAVQNAWRNWGLSVLIGTLVCFAAALAMALRLALASR
jgi:hypothetical protein